MNKNTQEKAVKERKYYLELLRVIAILLVMYNHSPAFMSFQNQSGVEYGISVFLSMLCKAAAPVFFMISGALLLGKDESIGTVFRKRVLKIFLALILFSFLYYLKLVLKGEMTFSLLFFFNLILKLPIFIPYWYMYAYLAFLVLLPLLRPIARHMTKEITLYLIALQIIFGVLLQILGNETGWWFCGYFDLTPIFHITIFYPLVGYGLDHTMDERTIRNKKLLLLNLLLPIVGVGYGLLVYHDYLKNGVYSEFFLSFAVSTVALLLFWDAKALFQICHPSERFKKVTAFMGDKVFGMYLLEGFLGTGGAMDIIFNTISPYLGFLPAYLIEIVIIFGIRLVGITILKKIPLIKSVL